MQALSFPTSRPAWAFRRRCVPNHVARGFRVPTGPRGARQIRLDCARADRRHLRRPADRAGLLAWRDGTCDRELNRRRGFDDPLQPPEAAFDPSEDTVSISAAMVMRATLVQQNPDVLALFDALVELLTGAEKKLWLPV